MKCLTCGAKIKDLKENKWFPFCSERCKMADLYSWFNEDYYINEQISEDSSENGDK